MPIYVAAYFYHDNEETRQKRAELADQHAAHIGKLIENNDLVVATVRAEGEPPGGEVIVKAPSKEVAREIIMADPNLQHGCGNVEITEFRAVAGPLMSAFTGFAGS